VPSFAVCEVVTTSLSHKDTVVSPVPLVASFRGCDPNANYIEVWAGSTKIAEAPGSSINTTVVRLK
jgi:hypothetical protein